MKYMDSVVTEAEESHPQKGWKSGPKNKEVETIKNIIKDAKRCSIWSKKIK